MIKKSKNKVLLNVETHNYASCPSPWTCFRVCYR